MMAALQQWIVMHGPQQKNAICSICNIFLINVEGDTFRTLNLTVKPKSSSTINQSICQGQTFLGHGMSGVYVDTLLAANGCDSIRTLNLTVLKTPNPSLGTDATICKGDTLILSPGNFLTYLWQDGSTAKIYTVIQAGIYTVTVTNDCRSTASDTITITENTCDVYFPNAFTPNNDGRNDVFKVLNTAGITNYQFSIYHRVGKKIFETTNPLVGWDGKINGEAVPTGTFIWYCKFTKQNKEFIMQGTILLVR